MAALPSGIVSFVFTDIEGSTRLFRRLGDRYPPLLERHNRLLRDVWDEHHGVEVKTEGDAFFVAFSSGRDAVLACIDGQRRLGCEPWPDDGVVRVRMGVHAGLAAPRGADYISYAVHQAARVVGAAHGGQVLVSSDAAAEVGGELTSKLHSLGRYRMRDFDEPVELFQAGDDRVGAFPALRAIPAEGHNLIRPPSSFLGRESDQAALASWLGPGRVVTVAGPGGVGKTRLVVETGLEQASRWRDGAWLVELASLTSGDLVAAHAAATLGVAVTGARPVEALVGHLQERQMLLGLDNCEHVLSAVAALVDVLLRSCPGLGVLVTSREPLGLEREIVWRLRPLTSDAVELFCDRAQSADAHFDPDEAERAVIEQICRRLDGLPLAIELAAARVGKLHPAEILTGLDDRFRLVQSRRADRDERHRSLGALLEWSHALLDEREQAVFRRLGVFVSSFCMPAAEAAAGWGAIDAADVDETVWSLVDKSLLVSDVAENQTRYRMLLTVQSFARSLLADSKETADAVDRAGTWMASVVGPRAVRGPAWLRDMRVEISNVRAALAPLASSSPRLAQQLACATAQLHDVDMSYAEGIAELEHDLSLLPAPTPERLALLGHLGYMHLQLLHEVPDEVMVEGSSLLAQGVAEPEWSGGRFHTMIALASIMADDLDGARRMATQALESTPPPLERARWCNLLGMTYCSQGRLELGAESFDEELRISLQLDDPRLTSTAFSNLAEAHLQLDNRSLAAKYQLEALDIGVQFGLPAPIAFSLIVAARLSGADGRWADAALLHAIADDILGANGVVLYDQDRRLSEELLSRAEMALGTTAYAAVRARGSSYGIVDACALARDGLEAHSSAPGATEPAARVELS